MRAIRQEPEYVRELIDETGRDFNYVERPVFTDKDIYAPHGFDHTQSLLSIIFDIKQYRYFVFRPSCDSDTSCMWKYYSKVEAYNFGIGVEESTLNLDSLEGPYLFHGSVIYNKETPLKKLREFFERYEKIVDEGRNENTPSLSSTGRKGWNYNFNGWIEEKLDELFQDIESLLPFLKS